MRFGSLRARIGAELGRSFWGEIAPFELTLAVRSGGLLVPTVTTSWRKEGKEQEQEKCGMTSGRGCGGGVAPLITFVVMWGVCFHCQNTFFVGKNSPSGLPILVVRHGDDSVGKVRCYGNNIS